MEHTYWNQRRSSERKIEHYSRRDGPIRSRSPIRRNRQRHSNSSDRSPIETRRQTDNCTYDSQYQHSERRIWNRPRSYASSNSSGQALIERRHEMEWYNHESGNDSDVRSFNEEYIGTRRFGEHSRRQIIPHSLEICKFYNNEGECRREDYCTYLHLCRHYITDSCKFGRICKRSHNIHDRQPMRILEKYGMAPDKYTEYVIVRAIKENNGKRNTISKTNLERPLLKPESVHGYDNVSDTASLSMSEECHNYRTGGTHDMPEQRGGSLDIGASDIQQNDVSNQSSQSEVDTFTDYIPLERQKKKKLKRDKRVKKNKDKSRHKIKDCKVEMVDAPGEGSANSGGQMIQDQSTMKLELQSGNQHFKVRNVTGRFQLSTVPGPWNDLSISDSEICSELFELAVQVGQVLLPKSEDREL